MRIQLMSDLHFEHHPDRGFKFIEQLDPTDVDVLVLAGDIGTWDCLSLQLERTCAKYPKVLMVFGNHHFYGSDHKTVMDLTRALEKKLPNFKLLDNEIEEIGGVRFLGTPLWFSRVPPKMEKHWSDFIWIENFRDWVYDENLKAQKFLEENLKEGDVVITHYLPSWKSVAPKYDGDPYNCFFVCDMEPLILKRKPKLWLHGHTHTSVDYKLGNDGTRVVCNPYGYRKYNEQTGYQDKLVLEV